MKLRDFFVLKEFRKNVKLMLAMGFKYDNRGISFTTLLFLPLFIFLLLVFKDEFKGRRPNMFSILFLTAVFFLTVNFVLNFFAKKWYNSAKTSIKANRRVIMMATNVYLLLYYMLSSVLILIYYFLLNR